MPRGPAVRKSDIDRTLEALRKAGLGVDRVEIKKGGEVVVIPSRLTQLPPVPEGAAGDWSDLDGVD